MAASHHRVFDMGGPCFIVSEEGEKRVGPSATDNFHFFPLLSVEQCYQAMKFPERSKQHTLIRNLQPQTGESEWDYGIKVWQYGQNLTERNCEKLRSNKS